MFHGPADSAAIIVGPPKAGKTRKVIAPTLACWEGPALVTSTKGDILDSAAHRAKLGPVALYDPTGSLEDPQLGVGFSPMSQCGSWDSAVEVAAALLSPASSDETVRHGEHFAIAARALLAPLLHAAALSGGGIDRVRNWLGRMEFSEPSGILRDAGAHIALESSPASPRKRSGITERRCSGPLKSRSHGHLGARSETQPTRKSHHRSTCGACWHRTGRCT